MKNKLVIATAVAFMAFGAFGAIKSYSFSDANLNMVSADEESPVYTLSFTINDGASAADYVGKHGTTCNRISWMVVGDESQENALRVGGKGFSKYTDKTLISQATLPYDRISKVVINHSGITNGEGSTLDVDFISVKGSPSYGFKPYDSKTKTIHSPSVSAPGSLVFQLDDGDSWDERSYFNIDINCKNPGETNVSYLTINSIDFYLEETAFKKEKTRAQLGFGYSISGEPATYEFSYAKLNFGGACLKTEWDEINNEDEIVSCGVAIARTSKLIAAETLLETLVKANNTTIIKTSSVVASSVGVVDIDANGNISENNEGNGYMWHADLYIPEGMYSEEITAVAYVVLDSGNYVFLKKTAFSVKSIATAYKGMAFYSGLDEEIKGAIDELAK